MNNPALADLEFLLGEWEMTISNAAFLSQPTVTGIVEITMIEAGRLLATRQYGDRADPPLASWVIGRDGDGSRYTVLYVDGRGVSRVYEMDLVGSTWRIWRDDPEFSQRFQASISVDRRSIDGAWEKRVSGGPWEHDFDVSYSKHQ